MINISITLETAKDGSALVGLETTKSGDNPEALITCAMSIIHAVNNVLMATDNAERVIDQSESGETIKAIAERYGFDHFRK